MPRRKRCRRVAFLPDYIYFKPSGIGVRDLEIIELDLSEIEAIRLKDYIRLDQEEAALKMGVSQPTFHRILDEARRKVAEAIINGMALKIKTDSNVEIYKNGDKRLFRCFVCGIEWEIGYGEPKPYICPKCNSNLVKKIQRDEDTDIKKDKKEEK